MSRRVFKYPLRIENSQTVRFTGFVEILSVAVQQQQLVLYVVVNPDDKRESELEVFIRGTGHDLGQDVSGYRFMGTHMTFGASLVWHVWLGNHTQAKEVKDEPT